MHRMSFQNGEADQWHHAFIYDADNRIQDVYTNTAAPLEPMSGLASDMQNELSNNSDWQHDARYYYYAHGPLSRVEIGQNTLQGVDYFYTLQGWLKGVNSSVLNEANDPGEDSNPGSLNAYFGKDVFGFGLSYYTGDYTSINGASANPSTSPIAPVNSTSHPAVNSTDLYNGNIRYMQTALTHPQTHVAMPMVSAYQYDQLNRLKTSRSYESGLSANTWNPSTYGNEYFNAFNYDGLGNILTQKRHLRDGTQIEDLEYHYQKDGNGMLARNRLYHLNDAIGSGVDTTDIDDMGAFVSAVAQINTDNNYSYDAQGRLVKDRQEEIDTILWTVTNKVKEIRRIATSTKRNLIFDYDAMGNRIAKHVYNNETGLLEKTTYYILDAQGQQISMYDHLVYDNSTAYLLSERNIFGSSRLGTLKDQVDMLNPQVLPSYGVLGNRNYELTNHLGNVLTVINDIKIPLDEDSDGNVDGYRVGISHTFDYSPFGVTLENRNLKKEVVVSQNCYDITEYDTTFVLNFETESSDWFAYGAGSISPKKPNLSVLDTLFLTSKFSDTLFGPGGVLTIHPAIMNYRINPSMVDGNTYHTSFDFDGGDCLTSPFHVELVLYGDTIPLTASGSYNFTNLYSSTGPNPLNNKLIFVVYGDTTLCHAFVTNLKIYTLDSIGTSQHCEDVYGDWDYRYAFQGQERDDEIKGAGNSINYKYRMHDPRIGRFFAIDPLAYYFPHNSPYAFSENRVLDGVELEGQEWEALGSYLYDTYVKPTVDGATVIKESFESFDRYMKSIPDWDLSGSTYDPNPHRDYKPNWGGTHNLAGDSKSQGAAIITDNAQFDNRSMPGQGANGAVEQAQRDQNPRYKEPDERDGNHKNVTFGEIERIKALTPADQSNQQKVVKQYAPPPKEIHSYSMLANSSWENENGTKYKSEVYVHSGKKPDLYYLYKQDENGKFELIQPENMTEEEKGYVTP